MHLTCPQVQYGMKNGFVPIAAPATGMMMMPPVLKQEDEEDKERRSGHSDKSGFDSFREDEQSNREEKTNNNNNAKKRSRPPTHPLHDTIERPETPFMNSPSAAADVLMSLCGDGDGGLFAAAPRQTNRRRRNSNSETTCTGQIVPLNLKCPRRKRTSLCKNIRRSSSGSSLEEDNGGENGAVVLHGITSNRQDNSFTTTTNPRIHDNNDNKASSMEQKQKRKHQHNSSGNNNGKNKRQKVHRPWSLVEVEALVAGVKRCGRGQWADIKSLSDESISGALLQRSAVDLKDKWRNVMRTALSPVLYKKREATEIPEKMLEDIRSLATPKEKETLATNNAANTTAAVSAVMANTISATATTTTTTTTATTIRSPSTSGDGNNSNTNEDGADHTFVANIKAESSQQKNTALVERNTIVSAKSDEKKYVQGQRRSKHHSPWTLEESQALVDGVRLCGCRWTAIKKRDEADAIEKKTFKRLGRRTAMDMKDKWRNLLQLANLPTQSRRKRETPMSLLVDVLELEKKFGDTRRRGRRTVATAATNNMKTTSSHKHHPPQTATAVATVVN